MFKPMISLGGAAALAIALLTSLQATHVMRADGSGGHTNQGSYIDPNGAPHTVGGAGA